MDVLKGICCGCCNLIQQEKEAEYLLSHESNQYINEQPGALKQDMSYGAPAAITAGPGANYGHQQTYTHDQKVAM